MTENEAKVEIMESGIELGAGDYVDVEALKVAVNALEEIQVYRAIGTVEEFKALKENQFFNFDSPVARVDKKSYDKGIDVFAEKIIDLVNEFPTVEDDFGEIRPMRIEEMCNVLAEQLKGEKQ